MTNDIFDKIKGYEEFHEVLSLFNKIMIEAESRNEFCLHPRMEIQMHIQGKGNLSDVTVEVERDVKSRVDIHHIIFKGEDMNEL